MGLLVLVAFIITFAVGFGIEEMREKRPLSKTQIQISSELADIKTTIAMLAKKVDEIQKELQE